MAPIEVFYHFYIPNNHQAPNWVWWLDQQLQLIRDSKLHDIADINMAVTMPKYIDDFGNWPIRANGNGREINQHRVNLEYKLIEYVALRYPFVNILNIRDTGEPNLYEGQTLRFLHDRCLKADIDVLYIHNKGVQSQIAGPPVYNWREVLNHFCIKEWPRCVRMLREYDIVAVGDGQDPNVSCSRSGNFWWSKSSYIRTLPNPLNSHEYAPEEMFPDRESYRYAFEYWVGVNNPQIGAIAQTNTAHYDNLCFVENFSK